MHNATWPAFQNLPTTSSLTHSQFFCPKGRQAVWFRAPWKAHCPTAHASFLWRAGLKTALTRQPWEHHSYCFHSHVPTPCFPSLPSSTRVKARALHQALLPLLSSGTPHTWQGSAGYILSLPDTPPPIFLQVHGPRGIPSSLPTTGSQAVLARNRGSSGTPAFPSHLPASEGHLHTPHWTTSHQSPSMCQT